MLLKCVHIFTESCYMQATQLKVLRFYGRICSNVCMLYNYVTNVCTTEIFIENVYVCCDLIVSCNLTVDVGLVLE